jgi:tRNA nucleotidyltransferase/poly(A) polymerase
MFEFAEVGGAVRDSLLGINSDDVDFVAILQNPDSVQNAELAFDLLITHLKTNGFEICQEKPEFFTLKAKVPENHPLKQRTNVADFVLARKDGPSSDGRRPDYVLPGTLIDDLTRRDFTINAMAKLNGSLLDFFGGVQDLQAGLIRFVGDPTQRIGEDGLRALRALRFSVTKGFDIDGAAWEAINSDFSAEMLLKVSADRVRGELLKMFFRNTIDSLNLLAQLNEKVQRAIFRDGLHLMPSLKKISKKQ